MRTNELSFLYSSFESNTALQMFDQDWAHLTAFSFAAIRSKAAPPQGLGIVEGVAKTWLSDFLPFIHVLCGVTHVKEPSTL